jgi:hypothetical protein
MVRRKSSKENYRGAKQDSKRSNVDEKKYSIYSTALFFCVAFFCAE